MLNGAIIMSFSIECGMPAESGLAIVDPEEELGDMLINALSFIPWNPPSNFNILSLFLYALAALIA